MNKIIIWTTGNSQTGYGHINRCISLAAYLRKSFQILFAIVNGDQFVFELLRKEGLAFEILTSYDQSLASAEPQIVVLDQYEFDERTEQFIKSRGHKVVTIADMADRTFFCDLLINHNPYGGELKYQIQSHGRLAVGTEYILLKNEFLCKKVRRPRVSQEIKRITFSLGGGRDISFPQVLMSKDWFQTSFGNCDLTIVNREGVNKRVSSRLCYKSSLATEEMAKQFSESDLVITTASVTSIEVLAIGCPLIVCVVAENQRLMNEYLVRNELSRTFGDLRNINWKVIEEACSSIAEHKVRKKMVENQLEMIDGKSPERHIQKFEALAASLSSPKSDQILN